MRKVKYLLILVAFLVALLVTGCGTTTTATKEDPMANWKRIENARPVNETAISARRISNAYLNNKLDGDEKYGGKVFKVYGDFIQIYERSDVYSVYIYAGGTKDEMIECYFRKDFKDELAKLKPDQQVIVKGEVGFDGFTYLRGTVFTTR